MYKLKHLKHINEVRFIHKLKHKIKSALSNEIESSPYWENTIKELENIRHTTINIIQFIEEYNKLEMKFEFGEYIYNIKYTDDNFNIQSENFNLNIPHIIPQKSHIMAGFLATILPKL